LIGEVGGGALTGWLIGTMGAAKNSFRGDFEKDSAKYLDRMEK